jgi:P27 family predicted phage terminase small subunit
MPENYPKEVEVGRRSTKAPSMPNWLTPYGKSVWRRTVKELEPLRLLSPLDRETLAGFCDAATFAKDTRELLVADGLTRRGQKGELVKHPAYMLWQQSIAKVESLGNLLALNPSARLRMLAELPDDLDDDDDDLD